MEVETNNNNQTITHLGYVNSMRVRLTTKTKLNDTWIQDRNRTNITGSPPWKKGRLTMSKFEPDKSLSLSSKRNNCICPR